MRKCLNHTVVAEPGGSVPLITKPIPGHVPVPLSPTSHLHSLTSNEPRSANLSFPAEYPKQTPA